MRNKSYKTSDMWLAAALMALGEEMVGLERGEGPRALFVFDFSQSTEMRVEEYKAGKLRIEPQKLFIQTKLLKGRLYD